MTRPEFRRCDVPSNAVNILSGLLLQSDDPEEGKMIIRLRQMITDRLEPGQEPPLDNTPCGRTRPPFTVDEMVEWSSENDNLSQVRKLLISDEERALLDQLREKTLKRLRGTYAAQMKQLNEQLEAEGFGPRTIDYDGSQSE